MFFGQALLHLKLQVLVTLLLVYVNLATMTFAVMRTLTNTKNPNVISLCG
jgi:hypothetical protein